MKYFFGICEWSLPVSGPLAIRLAKEAGFDGMQIGEAGGRQMGYPLNHKSVQEIYRETAQQYDLKLHSLNLGALLSEGTMNYAEGTTKGEWARKSLVKGFEACRTLDIPIVVITVDPTEATFDHIFSHLDFACRLAKDSGIEIAIESGGTLEMTERLLGGLDSDVKICMDILNPFRFGTGNAQEQIAGFGKEKISHLHVKDSKRELFHRGQRGCVLLGEGDSGFAESVEALKAIDYEGWIMTENYYYLPPMNDGDEDFMDLAIRDLMTMRKAFRQD
ncbi:sugar phosphate isomerase/epimerase family protein [Emergencia timonensis]|uniref:sugar phosphate isomerase/epimerase family protein n=1 Tax=Emergencia timonensis TaxID=1776384 RepID=UPI003996585D